MPRHTVRRLFLRLTLLLITVLTPQAARAQGAAEPLAPALLAPGHGEVTTGITHPPLGIPLLRWAAVDQAALYHVQLTPAQVDGACDFTAPTLEADTTATSFAVADPAAKPLLALRDGVWCWRVRAAGGSVFRPVWGPYSAAVTFVKDWGSGGALRPTLLLPAPGAEPPTQRASFQPGDFSWTAVPGAATYWLEIAAAADFAPESAVYAATTLGTAHTPAVRLPNGTYFWRVTPFDSGGNPGAASAPGRFALQWNVPPTLLAPDDGLVTPFTPRFEWTAVEGASEYVLEISTASNFTPAATTAYRTRNSSYTPTAALDNHRTYFWRVHATATATVLGEDGTRALLSPHSAARTLHLAWDFTPQLLTPGPNTDGMGAPYFAWTPVPGAARYRIQIDSTDQFLPPFLADAVTGAPAWTQPTVPLPPAPFWWRVTAYDAQGNSTPASAQRAYHPATAVGPNLIYPQPYDAPDAANLPVHAGRTLAWPVFVWNTAHVAGNDGIRLPVDTYRLTVDEQADFAAPNIVIETAGLGAAPTPADIQQPLENGRDYFWRVQAFSGGAQVGGHQTWSFRYDSTVPELPFATAATPIHPPDGFEAVGDPPMLGWLPVTGAARYRVQLAAKGDFAAVLDEAVTEVVNYAPWQGRTERMPSGAYWWRVRPENAGGAPFSEWSTPRRFLLATDLLTGNTFDFAPPGASLLALPAAGEPPGYVPAMTLISPDQPGSAGDLELGALHMMVDRTYNQSLNWVIAFGASPSIAGQVRYVIYADIDHVPGSGATFDPVSLLPITGDPLYRPEYAIHVTRAGNAVDVASVLVSEWNAAAQGWNAPRSLASMAGGARFDAATATVQLLIPYAALGGTRAGFSGTLAVTLFSTADGAPVEVVPAQGFEQPALVSDMITPLYPFDTGSAPMRAHTGAPALRWRTPIFDSVDGYEVEVARDAAFTDIFENGKSAEENIDPYFELLPDGFQPQASYAQGTYYWRVRLCHERYIRHEPDKFDCGPWSPPVRFSVGGLRPQGLTPPDGVTVLTTPAFTWARVEGAAGYLLQVGERANLDDPANVLIERSTDATSFTPTDTRSPLAPGDEYFWRVAVRHSDGSAGEWSDVLRFIAGSAAPQPTAPLTGTVVGPQPTFTWAAVLTPTVDPRLAAPRYKLTVDNDSEFGSPAFSVETQSTSYTPPVGRGLKGGDWYWRVALLDAGRCAGPTGPAHKFTLLYPLPALLEPERGPGPGEPPLLRWAAVEGAAYYRVEYADNDDFSNKSVIYTAGMHYAPTRNLKPGAYSWRVQMVDADGNPGPFALGRFVVGHVTYLPAIMR